MEESGAHSERFDEELQVTGCSATQPAPLTPGWETENTSQLIMSWWKKKHYWLTSLFKNTTHRLFFFSNSLWFIWTRHSNQSISILTSIWLLVICLNKLKESLLKISDWHNSASMSGKISFSFLLIYSKRNSNNIWASNCCNHFSLTSPSISHSPTHPPNHYSNHKSD